MKKSADKSISIIDCDNLDFSHIPDEPMFIDEFVRDENGEIVVIRTKRNPKYDKSLKELQAKKIYRLKFELNTKCR